MAPNCATFSRAREIPIKGVANPPRPLRNEEFPGGIPSEINKMNPRSRRRLMDDTKMADLSAGKAWEAMEDEHFFTLEHPRNSLALHLKSWQKLLRDPRVFVVPYHTCMFEGSRRRKSQVLITNGRTFRRWVGRTCSGGKLCDRTGLPHLKWRPTVSGGRVIQFKTGNEREYPVGFLRQLCSSGLGASRAAGELHRSFLRSKCTPEPCTGQTFRSTSPGESHSRQGPRGKQRADEVSTFDSPERPIEQSPSGEGQSCMPDQPRPHGGGEQTTRVREESAAHPRRPWGPADPPWESSYSETPLQRIRHAEGGPPQRPGSHEPAAGVD